MDAAPLIYSDPERDSGGSVLTVTNDSLFKKLADYADSKQEVMSECPDALFILCCGLQKKLHVL